MPQMLIREGDDRDSDIDRRLAVLLALVAGALNAAAFHAVGFFSANMTGNVSVLSDLLASGRATAGLFFLGIVLAFVLGACLSTVLVNAGRRAGNGGIYAYSILLEALMLTALGAADLYLTGDVWKGILIISLSFLMGLQNAVVTRISNARVRTTHVSGMLTDIGIGIGILFDVAFARAPSENAPEVRMRLRLHIQTVASFLFGGVAGVLLYRAIGGGVLIAAAAILLLVSIPGLKQWKRLQGLGA